MKSLTLFVLLSCGVFLSACSGVTKSPSSEASNVPSVDIQKAISGELVFGRKLEDSELPKADLFGLTDEMREFADRAVKFARTTDRKVERLHMALLTAQEKGGLGVQYSVQATSTASEVFSSRKANCLGHSLLFVAMANYVGVSAAVNQVDIPPTWYMDDSDTFLLMRHVNTKVNIRKMPWSTALDGHVEMTSTSDMVVDLDMRRYRSHYKQRLLDEDQVATLFHNNRAMELMAEGKMKESFMHLKSALVTGKNESFIWSNLGSFYRRQGEFSTAETVYLKALSLDETDLTVLHNLAGLYTQLGREQDSLIYRDRVKLYRDANPYYQYQVAKRAMREGDWQKAELSIIRALSKQKNDNRLYLLAAEIYEHQGLSDKADVMRKKADAMKDKLLLGQI